MKFERLIYGAHAIKAALKHAPESMVDLNVMIGDKKSKTNARIQQIIDIAMHLEIPVNYVDRLEFERNVGDVKAHQGLFANMQAMQKGKKPELDVWLTDTPNKSLVLILDQITDPHNLGACLRTADAAGCDWVILPKDNAAPLNATVKKVAAGAAETLKIEYVSNLARTIDKLKEQQYWIYGLDENGDSDVYHTNFAAKACIVMGSEGQGLRALTRKSCDHIVSIPMLGGVESLNVSVATGVALFQFRGSFIK